METLTLKILTNFDYMHSCGETRQKSILGVFISLAIKAQTIMKPSNFLSNT